MKKCAVINDLSGFGKCSLGVALPVISVMGSEVHPLPTAVLSNQTGYDSYSSVSLTDSMNDFMAEWDKLGVSFDGIMTGFVSDEKQLDIISSFVDRFKTEDNILLVDPVMADNGALYDGYTIEMCSKIRKLCFKADIITPNAAELAFLADEPYSEDVDTVVSYAKKLAKEGMKSIVVTGCKNGEMLSNIVLENGKCDIASVKETGGYYSGTGDILASVVMGGILRGMRLFDAVSLACGFIEKSILATDCENHNEGINFEKYLGDLI